MHCSQAALRSMPIMFLSLISHDLGTAFSPLLILNLSLLHYLMPESFPSMDATVFASACHVAQQSSQVMTCTKQGPVLAGL